MCWKGKKPSTKSQHAINILVSEATVVWGADKDTSCWSVKGNTLIEVESRGIISIPIVVNIPNVNIPNIVSIPNVVNITNIVGIPNIVSIRDIVTVCAWPGAVLMSVLEWTQDRLDDLECFAHHLFQDMGNILDLNLLREDSINKQVEEHFLLSV